MRILICGDRRWHNFDVILSALMEYKSVVTCVIHGGTRGADIMGGSAANLLKIPVEVYPAPWRDLGKSAGPVRNLQMLTEGKPDLVLAFHHNLSQSKGTKHMLKIAQDAGVKTILFDHEGYKNESVVL